MKTICITNQKGGIGKSTTAAALQAGLILKGYKVLLVELDSQCNTSKSYGAAGGKTALGVLTREITAADAIQHREQGDIIAACKALAGADTILSEPGTEYRLREALEPISSQYDFCIVDTPPSLGKLTVNALTAGDYVVIPVQADIYSIDGVAQTWETIKPVKKYCNPKLEIAGVLLTRFSDRACFSRDIEDTFRSDIALLIGSKVFDATIREAIAVKEAQYLHKSLFSHAPRHNVTADYSAFIEELLETIKNIENQK